MHYFYIEPEVAGGLGPNTVRDRSVHPPIVSHLNYEFDGWPDDVLVEAFPSFIVTPDAMDKLLESGLTGARFANVEISKSGEFEDFYPDTQLPRFVWLQITGRPGRDDFGLAADHRLVISERALDVLKGLQLTHALIEPFGN